MNTLFDFIQLNFSQNEPILVSELETSGYSANNIRQQLMILASSGKLNRYDTGVYYLPKKSIFKTDGISQGSVIEKKYFYENKKRCGYFSGLSFANKIGATTQVPNVYEVTTNKASNECRTSKIASSKIIIRKPKTTVTEENFKILQLMDFIKDFELYSELSALDAKNCVQNYMKKAEISFLDIEKYLDFYPESIYKNMYKVGILNGVSSQ